ncbi:hypothetical protein [Rathayibacter iranicus]|uniref:Phosphatidate cytidylyltransferase n=2 Tax=Rathayibacter iranicus TaxID=59737 RepID=A0AAD1AFZ1_9MICO|nr:hypothetical protein [Rathayibacter iranicus]AZZ55481.1 hypothetical protein C7V51_05995 [Rathayibacter iranicus]MWV31692.1 hypothetical protein [Rathayibacter iranicus NCPPB 2253 = VKM Ac-1602]PPI48270.1 hypothetical protein C5E09_05070 [Rathayibacter iranicus]PPI60901.1 hypothetical protein C5E08_05975 [Rathayibacter iranicus]PPI72571.1 hypothetical protein C5E01_04640 [Rathayibacter iranicus]
MAELFAALSDGFRHIAWGPLVVYLLLSTLVMGNIATYFRRHKGWKDGYSRKFNHMGHAVCAAPTIGFLPEPSLTPTIVAATIGVAVIYGWSAVSRWPAVERIVAGSLRDRDVPYSRFFFFFPLILGNLGIVAAFVFFPADAARAGILAVAIGDGLAEPVGLRFGRNTTYRVPDLVFRRSNTKSLHGNAAVMLSAVAIAAVTFIAASTGPVWVIIAGSLAFGIAVAAIEALSPRGFDNLTISLGGALIMTGLIA